jgi:aminopeptidase N
MVKYFAKIILLVFFASISVAGFSQFTHQDTLRGSIGDGRWWWDVMKYELNVSIDIANKSIRGSNLITFKVESPGKNRVMQIDLQRPMEIEKIEYVNRKYEQLSFKREGNVYWVDFGEPVGDLDKQKINIHFKGVPREAVNPPWDGGWVWTRDTKARPWITVACQGLGASVWYPCKDHQGDEPNMGAGLSVTVPDPLIAVGNGRLKNKTKHNDGTTTWQWEVVSPINSYNIVPYIGYYANWTETYTGETGNLDCSYWVMDYNLDKAKQQFGRDVKPMLKCFESWFGPYPFYEDGYKMVESPHLGMEHQSNIAYGNKFKNGYLGMDMSGTGWGNSWDYIIIHESGHEWFGNNITTADIADMWVHEGFTNYSEALFVECQSGKKAGSEYVIGLRNHIENDKPIIGPYGVNKEGSGDMYPKGANMIHTIRQIIDDDKKFKEILRGLNSQFYHKVVNSAQVEKYLIDQSGKDLSKIFDQYLRGSQIPTLEWKLENKTVSYRWTDAVPGFIMPVKLKNGLWLKPTSSWQTIDEKQTGGKPEVDENFYISTRKSQ